MKMPISKQLVFFSCGLIFAALITLIVFVHQVLAVNYEQQIRANDMQLTQLLARNVYQTMDSAATAEKFIAEYDGIMTVNEDTRRKVLRDMRSFRSWYELLAIIDMNGMQIARSDGENQNRADRKWYRDFVATKEDSISPVYFSATSGNPVVTAIKGIGDKNNPQGMVMADMSCDAIQKIIDIHNDSNVAEAYLLDAEGNAIARPNHGQSDDNELYNYFTLQKTVAEKNAAGQLLFDETGKPLLRREPFTAPYDLVEIMKETAAGKVGNREFTDTKGERYFCFYRPVNLPNISTRWSLLVVRPYKSVTAALADTMNKTIFAGVLMAVLASFAAILFSRRFTKPLMEIMRVAQDVRGGNYDCKIEVQRSDEVGMLAEAINHMIGGLKSAKVQSQEAETQIRNIAYHDALTGLVNRMHFNVYARSNITASMTRGGTGALFFVDVDKFKHVNDTFGHGVGDELLNIFGQRLMMATGKYDRVCRFGGDEFIVHLIDANEQAAARLANTIVALMRTPFVTTHHKFNLSASVGVACYPKDADNIDELLRKADAALYVAKDEGRDRFAFYEEGMEKRQDDAETMKKIVR